MYLPLDPDFTIWLAWTDSSRDHSFETYFNPDQEVNIAREWNIPGFRPVLKEGDDSYNFLLTDDRKRWQLLDEFDEQLLWVKDEELEELETNEQKTDFILCGRGGLETEVVYMNYHPADEAGIREV
jgi:hypothetical protein